MKSIKLKRSILVNQDLLILEPNESSKSSKTGEYGDFYESKFKVKSKFKSKSKFA